MADPSSAVAGEARRPLPFTSPRWIHEVPKDQLGLKLPNKPIEDAQVDIVAVHGLGAIPAITWKEKHSGVNWLENDFMLPCHVPKARIMTFGYDSIYVGKNPVRTSVEVIANTLLESLEAQRKRNHERPLIFIAHCFGGLVVEKAILLSQLRSTSIVNATTGIVFLGTPHRGTEAFSDQGQLMSTIVSAVVASPEDDKLFIEPGVLSALQSMNGKLVDGLSDFVRLCNDRRIHVCCFFETRRSDVGRLIGRDDIKDFMVDETSAALEGHPSFGLSVDHFALNKYANSDDGNFCSVRDQLVKLYNYALQLGNRQIRDPEPLSKDEIKFLESFDTSSYNEHKRRIDKPVPETCQWFTEHPQFISWNNRSTSDLLWLSADPGCGKSVLAKYLIDENFPHSKERTVTYFFFKDDNEEQKLGINAISALLHQLLSKQPSLLKHATKKFGNRSKRLQASLEDIWSLLMSVTAQEDVGEILCILDALDECEDSSRLRFIDYFLEFYSGISDRAKTAGSLKILVTSRPYYGIERRFKKLTSSVPTIRLAAELETEKISREINLVIDWKLSRLKQSLDLENSSILAISKKLKSMEHRTYLWLSLILDVLEDSLEITEKRLSQTIDSIPDTVYHAYTAILSKSPNPAKAVKALEIIVCAKRPLTVQEMNVALAIEGPFKTLHDLDLESESRFQSTLRQLCGLFISVVDSKVYLFHQTAKEFLLAQAVVDNNHSSKASHPDFGLPLQLQRANYCLATICLRYLFSEDLLYNSTGHATSRFVFSPPQEISTNQFSYPLISYAANYWDKHVKKAKMDEKDSLNKQILELCKPNSQRAKICISWRWLNNPLILAHASSMNLLLQLGMERFFRFPVLGSCLVLAGKLETLLDQGASIDICDSEGGTPLLYAVRSGCFNLARALVECGADVNFSIHPKSSAFLPPPSSDYLDVFMRDVSVNTPLGRAIYAQHDNLARFLVSCFPNALADEQVLDATIRTSINYRCEKTAIALIRRQSKLSFEQKKHTRFAIAVRENIYSLVESLLDKGVSPTDKGDGSVTLWEQAVQFGRTQILELMSKKGLPYYFARQAGGPLCHYGFSLIADPIGSDESLMKTLSVSFVESQRYRAAFLLTQFLMDRGLPVDYRDDSDRSLLSVFAEAGARETVEVLLENHADMNLCDSQGKSPLNYALLGQSRVPRLDFPEKMDLEQQIKRKIGLVEEYERIIELLIRNGAQGYDKILGKKRTKLEWYRAIVQGSKGDK